MIVFKTFLKILNKCKVPIIMYTFFLIFFGGFNMQTSDNSTNFVASKPDILIVNEDENKGITKNLINYIKKNCNIIDIKNEEDARNDALFYRDVNYIIYIPNGFRKDFMAGSNPKIQIKSTGDYQSSYAEMLLERYLNIASIYKKKITDEEKLISKINTVLAKKSKIKITSKLDANKLSRTTFYYNFLSYSILAGAIYVICLILSSFKEEKIKKRTLISSMDDKKYNQILLLSNFLFAFVLWIFYIILSIILCGNVMFGPSGIIYIINSLVFTFCAVTLALLISNLINNKNAINGIINVVALGSSFLCGAFVPIEWLPDFVLKIAHILPSYWYIQTNELLKTIEVFHMENLKPIFINIGMLFLFSILFIAMTNIISKHKQKIM